MVIITKQEAKEKGLVQYFTGKPCKRGHIAARSVSSSNCYICHNEYEKKKRDKDPNIFKELKKSEYIKNKETILIHQKQYREKNWNSILERRKNSSEYKKYMRMYFKRYLKREIPRAKFLARTRKRQLALRKAVPAWFEPKEVEQLYVECARLTSETNIPHQVDHIIPLQNKMVCGLHCIDNLRIVTREENREKWNKLLDEFS